MAGVDPYSPCPCGSGQKFKWCCQKVESYAERAQRLVGNGQDVAALKPLEGGGATGPRGRVDNGQYESALKPLEEGLAKVPDSPWLLTRKALIHLHLKQLDP